MLLENGTCRLYHIQPSCFFSQIFLLLVSHILACVDSRFFLGLLGRVLLKTSTVFDSSDNLLLIDSEIFLIIEGGCGYM